MAACLTTGHVAAALDLPADDVRALAAAGQIAHWRTPTGRLRFDPDLIAALAAAEGRAVPDPDAGRHPCGSEGAYHRHLRAGATPCQACLGAHRRTDAIHRARRDGWTTTAGACTILAAGHTAIARWCDRGALEAVRTLGGQRRITWDSIHALLDQQLAP